MPHGVIQRIVPEEGFGFLREGQREYFFHRTGLNGTAWEELAVGLPVEFSVGDNEGDRPGEHPRAVNVRLREDVLPAEDNEPLPREKLGPR
jgi:cold shock CspA family protein